MADSHREKREILLPLLTDKGPELGLHGMDNAGTSSEQMDNGKHVSLGIDKLAESVEGKLKILRPFSDKCSIYRVPKRLRELNEKAYTPQVISIGPLHHGKEELKELEEHKRLYLMEFLQLSNVSVKDYIAAISERETRLRDCYAETFENLSKDEFVEMVLLDSSFVIMYILKPRFDTPGSNIDRIFSKPGMYNEIRFDLCLLENQLPFFILEDLLKLSKLLPDEYSTIKLTHEFLYDVWKLWVPNNILEQINSAEVDHVVGFLRMCQLPAQRTQTTKLETLTAPSVAELHQAGIKFESGSSKNLLDIRFDDSRGTLEIPQLKIVDQAEILFRNLQAFEQCNATNKYVNDYITMFSLLVPAAKDVEILIKEGIIENWLRGNDAVSSLFNNLSKENMVNINNFYFSGVVQDLNKYYSKRSHKWKAALKQNYFQNPWTIISVVAAGVLLILTVIQTVCSILQVK